MVFNYSWFFSTPMFFSFFPFMLVWSIQASVSILRSLDPLRGSVLIDPESGLTHWDHKDEKFAQFRSVFFFFYIGRVILSMLNLSTYSLFKINIQSAFSSSLILLCLSPSCFSDLSCSYDADCWRVRDKYRRNSMEREEESRVIVKGYRVLFWVRWRRDRILTVFAAQDVFDVSSPLILNSVLGCLTVL